MDATPKILKREKLDAELSLEARLDLGEAASNPADGKVLSAGDLAHRGAASRLLEEARREADAIRARAKALYLQVEEKVREAREKGHAEGREEGLASVTEMKVRIRDEHAKRLAGLEKEAVALVFEIARKMIGEAFQGSPEALAGMVRQALSSSMGNELTVLVAPADYERLKSLQSRFTSALHGSQVLHLKPAETVKPGSCVIESEMGTVEADLERQFAAIRRALEIEDGEGGTA